jgi:hypothetical protein
MIRLFRLAFWAAAAFAFVMAVLPQPPGLAVSDKLQHITAFLVITGLGCAAYPRMPRARLLLAMIAFGGVIELVQLVPELGRDGEWSDWLADILAVAAALGFAHWVERWRAAPPD